MKLATLRSGGRDGALIVVSRDLKAAVAATSIARSLQAALDDWARKAPKLAHLSDILNAGKAADAFTFDPTRCAPPLPRAYQWADASAYANHEELLRKADGASLPPWFWTEPLVYQGASDSLSGACDPIRARSEDWGIDLGGQVAVIVDDVPMGVTAGAAAGRIRLVMLANEVSLREVIAKEQAKGWGFLHGKLATAFSPVAVSLDELSQAWDGGKLHGALSVHINGQLFGRPDAGVGMTFDFPMLIAHAARSRELEAGSIVGSGTVSNPDPAVGCACLAEKRVLESAAHGKPATPYLRFGDRVRIEMFDSAGRSIFGAIDQEVVKYVAPE